MAIYHFSCNIISRGKGKNIVSSVAYRTGTNLTYDYKDKSTGIITSITYNYSSRMGIIYTEILSPVSDKWSKDREQLWNIVEAKEVRKDAQLAKEFILGLPLELTREQNINLVKNFTKEFFIKEGMVADYSINYEKENNPCALIITTTRTLIAIDSLGHEFGTKNLTWNNKLFLVNLRKKWADSLNGALREAGHNVSVNHKSYKDQGIDKVPTIHEGVAARKRSHSERIEINNKIKTYNRSQE